MYIYAAECVKQRGTPFFGEMRAAQSVGSTVKAAL
jgi:hypothetical protein